MLLFSYRCLHVCAVIAIVFASCTAATNFTVCLRNLQAGPSRPGLLNNAGRPVANPRNATAISYALCKSECGVTQEPVQWNVFSSQFAQWLLPWLALILQLPFGSRRKFDNLMSILLAVGSPALAAYSLTFTILNGEWVAEEFTHIKYTNVKYAQRILVSLQQSPLRVNDSDCRFSSLVILRVNDEWWKELSRGLNYKKTWSLSAVTQIIWVIIAYLLTVINSFTDPHSIINSNGQGVGAVFLWLLPVVIGYLQLSPKCDDERVHDAVERVNDDKAYLAVNADPDPRRTRVSGNAHTSHTRVRSGKCGIYLQGGYHGWFRKDEEACAPIYNYARFFHWTASAEYAIRVFSAAARKATDNIAVGGGQCQEKCHACAEATVCCRNRQGDKRQVHEYVHDTVNGDARPATLEGTGVFWRFFVSVVVALILQWGTVGGGILVVAYTPTKGLGCRSGAYILYAIVGTVVLLLMTFSSLLAYYSSPPATAVAKATPITKEATSNSSATARGSKSESAIEAGDQPPSSPSDATGDAEDDPAFARRFSIFCCWLGKGLAALNSAWIILVCVGQFASFFDTCYCNSSVLGLGRSAYAVITLTSTDIHAMNAVWVIAIVTASLISAIYFFFVWLYVDSSGR
ncbi:hypothetical protein PENSPDRAFT_754287 [Peniophora sp. CONT]|nr:hypothetical protein PENSPDRAFT_754287 [Peniophora sp. CONT]